MKYIGAHVSASGGVFNAPKAATEIGANTFALFTKNQRQWNSKPLTESEITQFKENMIQGKFNFDKILPHDSYLINLGNSDTEKRERSYQAFLDEIIRVEQLGLKLLNFHPGSHLGEISEEDSLKLIADSINRAIADTKSTILVIENTAGQGSNLGYKFEHLAYIISKIHNKDRVGVCLDTCHTHSSGYDLSTIESFQTTMGEFEKIIGFNYLYGMHLNDSKTPLGSKKDRHESLGKGSIGMIPFMQIMQDTRFDNIPLILETPDDSLWADEIRLLRSFAP